MILQAKGIDGHGRPTTVCGATQHALARGVIEVLLLVGGTDIPLGQVVEQVIGQRRGGVAIGATGDVAPVVVPGRIDRSVFRGAGTPGGIHTTELMRLAVTVEVLVAAAVQWSLPELTQMG